MKERLDVLLVKSGYAASREKAKAAIHAGLVAVDGVKQTKASAVLEGEQIHLELLGSDPSMKYVSRGGLKLEKAVSSFGICLQGRVCMDIGASTGGFTDCMLQNGAVKVYAVDVGTGQLSSVLREDPRVICMEKTNFRYLEKEAFDDRYPDFASIDVSFISLTKMLLPAQKLLKDGGEMVCLIKPQFEAGREKIGKNGVVKEPAIHRNVLHKILDFAAIVGFDFVHLDYSPIRGPEGNIEYLAYFQKGIENMGGKVLLEAEAENLLAETITAQSGVSWRMETDRLIAEMVQAAHMRI